MTVTSENLVIIGASARAAAFSGLRAGLRPWCADLFGDADLCRLCPAIRLAQKDYPTGFFGILDRAPAGPLLYTGALENHAALIGRLSKERPLWGNDAAVVRRIRRPWLVAEWLERGGLPYPAVLPVSDLPIPRGKWLLKPLAGGGGRGVTFLAPSERVRERKGFYLQSYVEGEACSAVYVADGRHCRLLGVSRQLVGEHWLNAGAFQYCGSIGPLALQEDASKAFVRLGNALVEGFGLCGIFGVDCVLQNGVPFPVEVNPRYPASTEVLEHALGVSALALVQRLFAGPMLARRASEEFCAQRLRVGLICVGKAVLYARETFVFPSDGPWLTSLAQVSAELPDFADIPHAGERILKGLPVITFFARGRTLKGCLDELCARAESLDRWLFAR